MEDTQILLDSPKRSSLQHHLTELRAALKEFERKFTQDNGRKPKQTDIKCYGQIASKYKEYHKVQEVLSGNLSFEKYMSAGSTATVKTKRYTRTDSGFGSSPRQQARSIHATPRKIGKHTEVAELEESSCCISDLPLLHAIEPTPHRDGRVLGLFDLMPGSGSGGDQSNTPTASTRKRKVEALYENTPAKRPPLQVIQTPSQRPSKRQGDLLDFLTGTPQKSLDPQYNRHSRTPQSEGRKFELNQFFATPSTQRFLFPEATGDTGRAMPSKASVIDRTPQKSLDATELEATPAYLRRSISFKDRLLSASHESGTDKTSSPVKRTGPPTLRHFRSSTSNIFRADDKPSLRDNHEADEYDDDLEALRELEDYGDDSNILVEESQLDLAGGSAEQEEPTRQYKKKGQKRTTRKANIKPTVQKTIKEPVYVAADDQDTDDEPHEHDEISGTNLIEDGIDEFDDDEFSSPSDEETRAESHKPKHRDLKAKKGSKEGTTTKGKKKTGTINPNAQSHSNYRTLKIRNKNSKANGAGRSKFGRSRR